MSDRTRQRINFWSSPRNISTALMYAFAQHPSIKVVDEPLYAHYLSRQPTLADHPGREEIIQSQPTDGNEVLQKMLVDDYGAPIVLFKQMTHHLIALNTGALAAMDNVLLIRDPRAILRSYHRVVTEVTAADIGLPQQYDLWLSLREQGSLKAVVDSRRLLLDPPTILQALCERLNVGFTDKMLRWPAGGRPEDGVWAKYWYANVHRSTGFQPYEEKEVNLPAHLEAIAQECIPLYREMLATAL